MAGYRVGKGNIITGQKVGDIECGICNVFSDMEPCISDKYGFTKDAITCKCGCPMPADMQTDPLGGLRKFIVCQFWFAEGMVISMALMAFGVLTYMISEAMDRENRELVPLFQILRVYFVGVAVFYGIIFFLISLLSYYEWNREPFCCCIGGIPHCCCICCMLEGDVVPLVLAGLYALGGLYYAFNFLQIMLSIAPSLDEMEWPAIFLVSIIVFYVGTQLLAQVYLAWLYWKIYEKKDEIHAVKFARDNPHALPAAVVGAPVQTTVQGIPAQAPAQAKMGSTSESTRVGHKFGEKFDPHTGQPTPKFDPHTGAQNW
jgi:hypothetical protein